MSSEISAAEEARGASSLPERMAAMLTRLGGVISALMILVVLATTAVSVFNRYFLGRPLMGVDEGTGFLVVGVVMFGAAEALRRGDHIRIDILLDRLSPRMRWWLELWSAVCVLAFSALLLITSWHTVVFSRQFGAYSTGYLSLPMWIPQSTMVIGALLILIAALAGVLKLFAETRR